MKQLRLLLAVFSAVFCLCVHAQTGSAVGEGSFFLYNVGADGYIVGANNWGTRASITKAGGISVTLALIDGSNYTVSCAPTYKNLYLGGNGYIDRPVEESSWQFVAVPGQINVYKMVCAEGTFFADEGATTTTVGADPDNAFAYWKLVTKEDRIADLASATADNPKDATFLILNPNFSRFANTDAWSIQSGNSNLSGGEDTNRCAEVYMSTFTLAQELTVPNGLYTFTGQGAVTYHDDRTIKGYDGGAKPELYLGDATLGFEEMIEGDRLSNMNQLSGSFSSGLYQLGPSDVVTVVNGKVTIGARCERADIWAIWDNFQLQYLGEVKDLGPFVEAYENAYAEAEQLLNSGETIGNSAKEKLSNALSSTKNVNRKSKEALENATAVLQEAIAAAKKSIASYKVIESGEVPNDDIAGWTCTNEQQFHVNTWSVEGNEDGTGMVTPFIENWINSNSGVLGDGMVYYTLEGLNPGEVYYAQALVRAYSEAGNEVSGLTFFVNGKGSYEKDVPSSGTAFTYGAFIAKWNQNEQPTNNTYLYIGTERPTASNISSLSSSSILYETSKPSWTTDAKGTLNVTTKSLYWMALPVSWGNITIQYGAFPVAQANMDDDTGEVFENITINGVEHIVRRFVLGAYPFEIWFDSANLQWVYGTFGSTVTVGDDGIITIGVKIADATFNWVALKNVTITKSENVSKITGDSNGDGIVNITDAMCNVDYILGKEVSPFIFSNADYNEDGVCDVTDVMLIVDYVLGKPQQPTQYYWYVGNADDPMPTSISPIVTDNTSVGWRLIGSSITDGQQIWAEPNDIQISTESKVFQRIIINSDNVDLKFYDSLGNLVEGFVENKTVNNGWTIFVLADKSKTFSINTKIYHSN